MAVSLWRRLILRGGRLICYGAAHSSTAVHFPSLLAVKNLCSIYLRETQASLVTSRSTIRSIQFAHYLILLY